MVTTLSSPTLLLAALNSDDAVPIIAVAGGVSLAIVWVVMWMISSMYKTRQVERSRREIAAYIAEGTISPEDGVKLMTAKIMKSCDDDE